MLVINAQNKDLDIVEGAKLHFHRSYSTVWEPLSTQPFDTVVFFGVYSEHAGVNRERYDLKGGPWDIKTAARES